MFLKFEEENEEDNFKMRRDSVLCPRFSSTTQWHKHKIIAIDNKIILIFKPPHHHFPLPFFSIYYSQFLVLVYCDVMTQPPPSPLMENNQVLTNFWRTEWRRRKKRNPGAKVFLYSCCKNETPFFLGSTNSSFFFLIISIYLLYL